jgi:hypothetical protein
MEVPSFIHNASNRVRREIFSHASKVRPPKEVGQATGEKSRNGFWATRARIGDDEVAAVFQLLSREDKIKVLDMIEEDLRRALKEIEDYRKSL